MNDNPMLETVDWYGETLNIYQLLERLDNAQQVVKALQRELDIRSDEHDGVLAELQERNQIIKALQRSMNAWAQRLARAGEYDHKGKNEVLLRVIADLLATAARNFSEQFPDDDQIPF